MRRWSWPLVGLVLLVSCSAGDGGEGPTATVAVGSPTIRLAFVGDVMLGRSVAAVVEADPGSVFERLRPMLVDADIAFANLESPLTTRPHLTGENALEADPAGAELLVGAGFDVLGLANNHAGDAGPETVLDTLGALESASLAGVGAGASEDEASTPLLLTVEGVTVGVLAFDLSGGQAATSDTPGVNGWDVDRARADVTELSETADVVVVGLHGGVEYLTRPDPALAAVVGLLADWGADVVWGHGAHVPYPVEVRAGPRRSSVLAPGLGNALFDQTMPRTTEGTALEVIVDADGVVAMRTGMVAIEAGRSTFKGWSTPPGDAVALDGDWWTPVRPWTADAPVPASVEAGSPLEPGSTEIARAGGDVTGTGGTDLVISYRRPATDAPAHEAIPEVTWVDELGRSAHLAVFTEAGRMRWGSALLFQPIGAIAVCDGSMGLGFTTLAAPQVVAGGAWVWDGFGFRTAPVLPGPASPGCADIDHDGHSDPVLTGRTTSNDQSD